jgi:hypothetical protein
MRFFAVKMPKNYSEALKLKEKVIFFALKSVILPKIKDKS